MHVGQTRGEIGERDVIHLDVGGSSGGHQQSQFHRAVNDLRQHVVVSVLAVHGCRLVGVGVEADCAAELVVHGGAQANGTRISPLNIISIPILITEVSKTHATIAFTVRLFLKAKLGWPKT